jgi:hypothetical protein
MAPQPAPQHDQDAPREQVDIADALALSDTLGEVPGVVTEVVQEHRVYMPELERDVRTTLLVYFHDQAKAEAAFNEADRIARGRGVALDYAAQLAMRGLTLEVIVAQEQELEGHPAGRYLSESDPGDEQP